MRHTNWDRKGTLLPPPIPPLSLSEVEQTISLLFSYFFKHFFTLLTLSYNPSLPFSSSFSLFPSLSNSVSLPISLSFSIYVYISFSISPFFLHSVSLSFYISRSLFQYFSLSLSDSLTIHSFPIIMIMNLLFFFHSTLAALLLLGSISSMFYVQILRSQIPKE